MTPANIIGMAQLIGLDVIALTDHNSCKNCKSIMHFGKEAGIIVIPGMELTTLEEVHVVCLFPSIEDAMAFDLYVYDHLLKIKNQEKIFGHQYLVNELDEIIASEPQLLINATDIPFLETPSLVQKYHGIIFPAHIDKQANSLLSNLGFIPEGSTFSCVEVKDIKKLPVLESKHPYLSSCNILTNSDAHTLTQINEAYATIQAKNENLQELLLALTSTL